MAKLVKFKGERELRRRLQMLRASVRGQALGDAVEEPAEDIAELAGSLAPRRTGLLSVSIGTEATIRLPERAKQSVGMLDRAFYGIFQELGTSTSAPQPFLTPAFDALKDQSQLVAAKVLRDAVLRNTIR